MLSSCRLYTATCPISVPGGTWAATQLMFGPVMEVLNRVAKSPSITLAASHPLPNVLLLVGLERVTAECEARFVAMLASCYEHQSKSSDDNSLRQMHAKEALQSK